MCDLALSWWKTTPYLLINSNGFFLITCFNRISCWHYRVELMVWPGSRSSWWTIPFQSHQTFNITFLDVNTGFATVCEASPSFDHDLFRTLLSYVIHFSSPVIIRFKNSSISCRFSSDSQIETRSIKFFTVNSCGTQVSSFFQYPVLCKWFKTVLWSMLSSVAMSRDKICRSDSIF